MITGKEKALKWFERSGKNSWIIYQYGKSDAAMIVTVSTPETDSARAYNELADALDLLGGRFTLIACEDGKRAPRSDHREDIELSSSRSEAHAVNVPPAVVAGLSEDEVSKRIQHELWKYKTEQELVTLRKENADLKRDLKEAEANDPLSQIAGVLLPMLPAMMGKQQAMVAGIGVTPQYNHTNEGSGAVEQTAEEITIETRLGFVIAIFEQTAPNDWLPMLEKLAAKVKANPAFLDSVKMFL